MISVVLCTYNGARFIGAQLDSMAAQTTQPAELVVNDDGSTDATVDILEAFAGRASFPVNIEVNDSRLGVPANFSRAIARVTGEIVAVSDQDDVWHPNRLERTAAALADPAVGAVFSDADLIDESGHPLRRRKWQADRFTPSEQTSVRVGDATQVLARHNPVCGATLAFRSSLRGILLPIPSMGYHDLWIAFIAAAVSRLVAIDEPLIDYRVHGDNQVGVRASPLANLRSRQRLGAFGSELQQFRDLRERLAGAGRAEVSELLDAKIAHLAFRESLPAAGRGRMRATTRELWRGRYKRYSRGIDSWLFDTFFRRAS